MNAFVIDPGDNVATALGDIQPGSEYFIPFKRQDAPSLAAGCRA